MIELPKIDGGFGFILADPAWRFTTDGHDTAAVEVDDAQLRLFDEDAA